MENDRPQAVSESLSLGPMLLGAAAALLVALVFHYDDVGNVLGSLWAPPSLAEAAPGPPAASQPLLSVLGTVSLRHILLGIHLVGLTIGFGSALFTDIYLLRYLYTEAVTPALIDIVQFAERMVACGLLLLWLSGIGFLLQYYFQAPEKIGNPKIWAKFVVVCLLTLNGAVIHCVLRPRLTDRLDGPLLAGESLGAALPLLALASVSATSWFFAAALGLLRELNNVVSWVSLLALYICLVASLLGAASAIHVLACRRLDAVGQRPAPEPEDEPQPAAELGSPLPAGAMVREQAGASGPGWFY